MTESSYFMQTTGEEESRSFSLTFQKNRVITREPFCSKGDFMAAKDVGRGFIQSPVDAQKRETLHLDKRRPTSVPAPEQSPERQLVQPVRSGTGRQVMSTGELTNPEWREVVIANRAWLDSQPTYRYVPTNKRKR